MKTAFIFPGQGAQYTGMGKGFYDTSEAARQAYDTAGRVCGFDMAQLCFEENKQLNETQYTQIAMLATEIAMLRVLEEHGIHPDICAGLSLGEYGALVAAGIIDYEDACRVVRKRGILMQEAVPSGGAMAAVLGAEQSVVEQICEQTEGIVEVANYNCPGQIVISGEKTAVDTASDALKQAGVKRIVPLRVSGPFHSSMLKEAGTRLGEVLETVALDKGTVPYVANVTAQPVTDIELVKPLLAQQVSSSVRWEQSVRVMLDYGIDTFIEIGPGRTLSGFMRKIDRNVKVYNVEKPEDVEKIASAWKGESDEE